MDTRDLWENQVDILTNHCRVLTDQVDQLDERLAFFENTVLTLIQALVKGGVIVPDEDGANSFTEDN
jgi:hypothetical protein